MKKKRLDVLLLQAQLAETIEQARALIVAGRVRVNGIPGGKAGSLFDSECSLEVTPGRQYVSRGGEKLAAGLSAFTIDPAGQTCADIGCSTGGFTDCLLQRGAARVYAVDVGYGVLDWKLRQDRRVVVLERTNARLLTTQEIPESIDLAVIDASFISLQSLLPPLVPLFRGGVSIIALVKPQFQLPRDKVGQGGVVRDSSLQREAVTMVETFARSIGLETSGVVASPIRGAKGNQEFLLHLVGNC